MTIREDLNLWRETKWWSLQRREDELERILGQVIPRPDPEEVIELLDKFEDYIKLAAYDFYDNQNERRSYERQREQARQALLRLMGVEVKK